MRSSCNKKSFPLYRYRDVRKAPYFLISNGRDRRSSDCRVAHYRTIFQFLWLLKLNILPTIDAIRRCQRTKERTCIPPHTHTLKYPKVVRGVPRRVVSFFSLSRVLPLPFVASPKNSMMIAVSHATTCASFFPPLQGDRTGCRTGNGGKVSNS